MTAVVAAPPIEDRVAAWLVLSCPGVAVHVDAAPPLRPTRGRLAPQQLVVQALGGGTEDGDIVLDEPVVIAAQAPTLAQARELDRRVRTAELYGRPMPCLGVIPGSSDSSATDPPTVTRTYLLTYSRLEED